MTDQPIRIDQIIMRRMAWDCLPCNEVTKMLPMLGLVPSSPSGDKVEHRDSHRRINRLKPIETELILFASIAGEVIARAILKNQGIEVDDLDDPELQRYIKAIHAGVVAVTANLLDGKIITLNAGVF